MFGDAYSAPQDIVVTEGLVLRHRIPAEGDVKYRIERSPYDADLIFSARAINTDRFGLTCLGMMIGSFIVFLFLILLAFLQIAGAWKI